MAKKNKSKSKKPGTISKYLKSRSKGKYTYKKPTVKYDPYVNSREQARRPASYDRIRQEQNKKRFEEAEKRMGKKYQIYDAIEDFSPGQIRNAQRRLGIKNATSKKEGARILRELINPTSKKLPAPPPTMPVVPPAPPMPPKPKPVGWREGKGKDTEPKSDPVADALTALQQTISSYQPPDYGAELDAMRAEQENYMQRLAAQQAEAERQRELTFRISQENIARSGLMPDFRIGARSPRDSFGTSAFRRRPRYTSTIAQGISPNTAAQTLNI